MFSGFDGSNPNTKHRKEKTQKDWSQIDHLQALGKNARKSCAKQAWRVPFNSSKSNTMAQWLSLTIWLSRDGEKRLIAKTAAPRSSQPPGR